MMIKAIHEVGAAPGNRGSALPTFLSFLFLCLFLAGCGGSSGSGGGDAQYSIGGTVSGLDGALTLRNNGGDDLAVLENGSFAFATRLAAGSDYAVTVQAQPTGQTCTVDGGSGTVGSADVTSVAVTCVTLDYSVGGTVDGLTGTVVLRNNGGDDLTVSDNGPFTFATAVAHGGAYAVTVLTQPAGQICLVSDGVGTVNAAAVDSVGVACTAIAPGTYSLGGSVTGLAGTVVLQNNGGSDLEIAANGNFTFAAPLPDGDSYAVTVLTQPTGQTCVVAASSGTIDGANVTDVAVTCTTHAYTVGGTVAGLNGTVVLQNNNGDDLTITDNGLFTFATPVLHGDAYAVTVLTQPTGQTCVVAGGAGVINGADVTDIDVNCNTNTYTVGGTVTGLNGTVVLRNNGGDDLTVDGNGPFAFATPVAHGEAYAVTVLTQPVGQTCDVSNGDGVIDAADVDGITVNCVDDLYTVGGVVTGLAGTVVLQNNAGDDLEINDNGPFTFATTLTHGAAYAVTVLTQPVGQTCDVSNGDGVIDEADVTSVTVDCINNSYLISGTVTGLTGTVVLQNNAGDDLEITDNGQFEFATPVTHGEVYAVTVLTQPAGQICTVTDGSGAVDGADVTDVSVDCVEAYQIGGTVAGLTGTLVLQNNGGDDLEINDNGPFAFATLLVDGSLYAVTVMTLPAGQLCEVTGGSGAVDGADVTDVSVDCVDAYQVGGTVTGLNGTLTLRNNGGDDLEINDNGPFAFATLLVDGSLYAVTVLAQPEGQLCTVDDGSGIIDEADVTDIEVSCINVYTIGGTILGLDGTLVLRNNDGDDLTVTTDGPFTFATPLPDGHAYDVIVMLQPPEQLCVVTNGSGLVDAADVVDISVECATAPLGLAVTLNPDRVRPGEGLRAVIRLANSGEETVEAIEVEAVFPAGLANTLVNEGTLSTGGTCSDGGACNSGATVRWEIASIEPGRSAVVSLPLQIDTDAVSGTVIALPVEIHIDGTRVLAAAPSVTVEAANALSLALHADRDTAAPGEPLTYTLTWANRGATGVDDAVLFMPLPEHTVFVSATGAGDLVGNGVLWSLGDLQAGESGRRQVVMAVDSELASGRILVAGAAELSGIAGATLEQSRATVATRVQADPALGLAIEMDPDPIASGRAVRSRLTVVNRSGEPLHNARLQARLPTDRVNSPEFVSSQLVQITGGATCPGGSCQRYEWVNWNLGSLAAGAGVTVLMPIGVSGGSPYGTLVTLDAIVSADGASPAFASHTVIIDNDPALGLALHEDRDAVGSGDVLTWTLTWGNRSGGGLDGATLNLPLPPGVDFLSASDGGVWSDGSVQWSLGAIAAGVSGTRQVEVAVDGALTDGTLLAVDAAEVSAVSATTGREHARGTAATRVFHDSPLALSVGIAPNPLSLLSHINNDEPVTATMTVTNTGDEDLAGVVVRARIPTDDIYLLGDEALSAGGTCLPNCNIPGRLAVWNIGTLAPAEQRQVTLTFFGNYEVPIGSLITVEAVANSGAGDQAAASHTVRVTP